jgi:hypothetical protein
MAVPAALITARYTTLILFRNREPHTVSSGMQKFCQVAWPFVALFTAVVITAFLLKRQVACLYPGIRLRLALGTLVLTRWLWRRWPAKERCEEPRSGCYHLLAGRRQASQCRVSRAVVFAYIAVTELTIGEDIKAANGLVFDLSIQALR